MFIDVDKNICGDRVLVHPDPSLVVKMDLWIENISFYHSHTPSLRVQAPRSETLCVSFY